MDCHTIKHTSSDTSQLPDSKVTDAVVKVFQTPELVEAILMQADIKQCFKLKMVNREFYNLLSHTNKFQRKTMLSLPANPYQNTFQQLEAFFRHFWQGMASVTSPFVCHVVPHVDLGGIYFEFRFGVDKSAFVKYINMCRSPNSMEIEKKLSSWRDIVITAFPYPIMLSYYGKGFENRFFPHIECRYYAHETFMLGGLMDNLEKFMVLSMAHSTRPSSESNRDDVYLFRSMPFGRR